MIRITVPGSPVGKQRARVYTNKYTKRAHAVTPEKTKDYENLIRGIMEQVAHPFYEEEPLEMVVIAYYPIPKSTSKKKRQLMIDGDIRPTVKPDFDNVAKICADALNGVLYHDDKQIVSCTIGKFYSKSPHVEIIVKEVC